MSVPSPASRLGAALSFLLALAAWQGAVWLTGVPVYVLPGPLAIAGAFAADDRLLLGALVSTLAVTAMALLASVVIGVALAVAMAANRWVRAALQPWTVVLQVTPIVAVAPLIIIWVGNPFAAMVVCATVIAFFPILSNTAAGLNAAPAPLRDLFRLSGASIWQEIRLLRLPVALPYFLAGLRVSGGLALVGAVVAEFVTGAGGFASGLAFRILEAGYRLQIARMFAALALLSLAGIVINTALGWFSAWLLRRQGAG
ncbi:MAG TPA: ABC transporter permease [Acetobacteraceae bacterium]|nr:ABC transporter permease [Acetobacteraceae bacterium]